MVIEIPDVVSGNHTSNADVFPRRVSGLGGWCLSEPFARGKTRLRTAMRNCGRKGDSSPTHHHHVDITRWCIDKNKKSLLGIFCLLNFILYITSYPISLRLLSTSLPYPYLYCLNLAQQTLQLLCYNPLLQALL